MDVNDASSLEKDLADLWVAGWLGWDMLSKIHSMAIVDAGTEQWERPRGVNKIKWSS